jgi:hypothetical protein
LAVDTCRGSRHSAPTTQQARTLVTNLGDRAEQFLDLHRESKLTTGFDAVFAGADIRIIRTRCTSERKGIRDCVREGEAGCGMP